MSLYFWFSFFFTWYVSFYSLKLCSFFSFICLYFLRHGFVLGLLGLYIFMGQCLYDSHTLQTSSLVQLAMSVLLLIATVITTIVYTKDASSTLILNFRLVMPLEMRNQSSLSHSQSCQSGRLGLPMLRAVLRAERTETRSSTSSIFFICHDTLAAINHTAGQLWSQTFHSVTLYDPSYKMRMKRVDAIQANIITQNSSFIILQV